MKKNLQKARRRVLKYSKLVSSDKFAIGYGFFATFGGAVLAVAEIQFSLIFATFLGIPAILYFLAVGVEAPAIRRRIMDVTGIYYKRCEFNFSILSTGDFEGSFFYHVHNGGNEPIDEIPSEGWIWFDSPKEQDIQYRVLNDESAPKIRNLNSNGHSIAKAIVSLISKSPFELKFNYSISPELRPGEDLKYEILVKTSGSEKEFFSDDGSYWGFPAIFPMEEVSLSMQAPSGYKIEVTKPVIVWNADRTDNQPDKESSAPHPMLNSAENKLSWSLSNVGPGDRYWSGLRMRKVTFGNG